MMSIIASLEFCVLLLLGLDLSGATRLGESTEDYQLEASVPAGTKGSVLEKTVAGTAKGGKGGKSEFDAAKAVEALVGHFGNESMFSKDRKATAETRGGGGDGADGDKKFKYLKTKCLKQRAERAAKRFESQNCKAVLEVGGYLTPLPEAVESKAWARDLDLYVDVDPSSDATQKEDSFGNGEFQAATLQVILGEFVKDTLSGQSLHSTMPVEHFDCFLMLGTWRMQVGDDTKQAALTGALTGVKLAILEYPKSDDEAQEMAEKAITRAGLEKELEHIVDCSSDEEAKGMTDKVSGDKSAALVRKVVTYTRKVDMEKESEKKAESKDTQTET